MEKVNHITNFALIRQNIPVPYEDFLEYDLVCFNPIRNKEAYNTVHLTEFLTRHGRKYISYPWLQWEGYHPGQKRSPFPWFHGWFNAALHTKAASYDSFGRFLDDLYAGTLMREEALRHLEVTTARQLALQDGCDIRIDDLIAREYQNTRLFLTPDHATTATYKHVVRQINDLAGLQVEPSFWESGYEVQEGIQLPILPAVREALGLRFHAGDFQSQPMGVSRMSLSNYARLHYHAADIQMAVATNNTRIYQTPKQAAPVEGEAPEQALVEVVDETEKAFV